MYGLRKSERGQENLESGSFICIEFAHLISYLLGEQSGLALLFVSENTGFSSGFLFFHYGHLSHL